MTVTHKRTGAKGLLAGALLLTLLLGLHAGSAVRVASAQASDYKFGDPAFQATWDRTDRLVDSGQVKRSFYWGPGPFEPARTEEYAEGPGGQHLVQYFDKSRMEINNPNGDRKNPFFVTNGLLTRELATGSMQVGNSKFVERWPAEIPLASDADDATAPTYASFRNLITRPAPVKAGLTLDERVGRDGVVSQDPSFSKHGVRNAYYEPATKHNIPDVFWQFLNATGPVIENGKTVTALLNKPYFYATGYPIAEAYWATVKIEGKQGVAVLVQPYERRVLTYVPSAPEGFKVQMGNIGRHYHDWRYKDAGKPATLQCNMAITDPRFSKVWSENASVQRQLGCMAGYAGFSTLVVYQPFQNGVMLDVIITDQGSPRGGGSKQTKDIFVLYNDGTAQRYTDTYVDGTPLPPVTAPAGLLVPQGGFGKLWRENAQVSQKIGYATAPEAGENAPNSSSLFLYFEKGRMVRQGNQVFVLYAANGASATDPNAWARFGNK